MCHALIGYNTPFHPEAPDSTDDFEKVPFL